MKPDETTRFNLDYNEALNCFEYHFKFDKYLSAWCGHKEAEYLRVTSYPPFDKNSCTIRKFIFAYDYEKTYKNNENVEKVVRKPKSPIFPRIHSITKLCNLQHKFIIFFIK